MFNLQEAFSKLNMLESSEFELMDATEKDAMKEFLEQLPEEDLDVEVIDDNAYDETELEDSYIGKIIIKCPVCQSLVFKTREEFDTDVRGQEISCPYCFSVELFDAVGKIEAIEDATAEIDAPIDESCNKEKVKEGCVVSNKMREHLHKCGNHHKIKESIENVIIETDDEVITVDAEPKCDDCDEPENNHETVEVITPLDDPEFIEFSEIDEESFDKFAESWLTESYKNIKSYKTVKFTENGRAIRANGVVTLEGGIKKRTTFSIRPGKLNESKETRVVVKNEELGIRRPIKGMLK